MKILIIEDERELSDNIVTFLSSLIPQHFDLTLFISS
jgi:DNA-binding response OmpR family regulator